jgi:hypothetical protein
MIHKSFCKIQILSVYVFVRELEAKNQGEMDRVGQTII